MVSQANGEGLVILPSDLSARCTAEALLFVEVARQVVPAFRDQAVSEESALYSAWAHAHLP